MKLLVPTIFATLVFALNEGAHALNVKMPGIVYTSRNSMTRVNDPDYCKPVAEVEQDMLTLAGIAEKVRITSLIDCNQSEIVLPAAKKANLKVMLGIWTSDGNDNERFVKEKAKLGMHRGEIPVTTAISYLNEIREVIRGRGYQTPLTVADSSDVLENSAELMDAVDFFAVNIMPDTTVHDADNYMLNQIRTLRGYALARNKTITITQTGWNSRVSTGVQSESQSKYFTELYQITRLIDIEFYWYTAFAPRTGMSHGYNEVELWYGLFNRDGKMENSFQQLNITLLEPYYIRQTKSNLFLSESDREVFMFDKTGGWKIEDEQLWLIDTTNNAIKSLNSAMCLSGISTSQTTSLIESRTCWYPSSVQMWSFDNSTGLLQQLDVKHCLHVQPNEPYSLSLVPCVPGDDNQQWTLVPRGSA
ncbi:putative ricin B, lectin domain, glycoside hydrolase superfamily, ricin B-like lectin [Plasmopara halstedii]